MRTHRQVRKAKGASTKDRLIIFTHAQQDAIARAIREATGETGFGDLGPWQREGIELARQALIRMFERTGMAYDHSRFSANTQPLASAIARDKTMDLRDIEADDDAAADAKETLEDA